METPNGKGQTSDRIKSPVTNAPRLVQILATAGFVVTDNDVIVKNGNSLVLRKRINGENPDGSPKYYDVPMQLSGDDAQQAAKAFATSLPTESIAGDIATETQTQPKESELELGITDTVNALEISSTPAPEIPHTIPVTELPIAIEATSPNEIEPVTEEEHLESAIIGGQTVLVGQVLAIAPHIAILDLINKNGMPHAILLDIRNGKELDISIAELESITSLPSLEERFN